MGRKTKFGNSTNKMLQSPRPDRDIFSSKVLHNMQKIPNILGDVFHLQTYKKTIHGGRQVNINERHGQDAPS